MGKAYKPEESINRVDILTGKLISMIIRNTSESLLGSPLSDKKALQLMDKLRDPTKAMILSAQVDIFIHISDRLSKSPTLLVGYKEPTLAEVYLEPLRLANWMNRELKKWSNV